jgi:hypothetical protein
MRRSLGQPEQLEIHLRPGSLEEEARLPIVTAEGQSCTIALSTRLTTCPDPKDSLALHSVPEVQLNRAQIRTMQARLGAQVDGKIGPETRDAVGEWEAALGRPVRCRITAELRDLLRLEDPRSLASRGP